MQVILVSRNKKERTKTYKLVAQETLSTSLEPPSSLPNCSPFCHFHHCCCCPPPLHLLHHCHHAHSLSCHSYPHCSLFPPCKQLLAAVVGGAVVVVMWSLWWPSCHLLFSFPSSLLTWSLSLLLSLVPLPTVISVLHLCPLSPVPCPLSLHHWPLFHSPSCHCWFVVEHLGSTL
jgi:hypothetical protein